MTALAIMIIWVIAMLLGVGMGRESMKYEMQCKIDILERKLNKG